MNREALEVLERSDCFNLFGDKGVRNGCNSEDIRQKQSAVGGNENTASKSSKPIAATGVHGIIATLTTLPKYLHLNL